MCICVYSYGFIAYSYVATCQIDNYILNMRIFVIKCCMVCQIFDFKLHT